MTTTARRYRCRDPYAAGFQVCRDCGDRMIHQTNRGFHESSSGFGQWLHDQGRADPARWGPMYVSDVDLAILKGGVGVLRVLEVKPTGAYLSDGQRAMFPLIGAGIQALVERGRLKPGSGMFMVRSLPPHRDGTVWRMGHEDGEDGRPTVREERGADLDGEAWRRFLTGEQIDLDAVREHRPQAGVPGYVWDTLDGLEGVAP